MPCLSGARSSWETQHLKGSSIKERPKAYPELTLATAENMAKLIQIKPGIWLPSCNEIYSLLLQWLSVKLNPLAPFRISKTFWSLSFFYTLKIELLWLALSTHHALSCGFSVRLKIEQRLTWCAKSRHKNQILNIYLARSEWAMTVLPLRNRKVENQSRAEEIVGNTFKIPPRSTY